MEKNQTYLKTIESAPNLIEVVRFHAQHKADQTAFVFLAEGEREEGKLTFGELDQKARSIAAWLQKKNQAGKPVALLYPQELNFVAAFLGCVYAGTMAVLIHPPRTQKAFFEFILAVRDAEAGLVLTTDEILQKIKGKVFGNGLLTVSGLSFVSTDTFSDYAEEWNDPQPSRSSRAFLQYTSGSTGKPKGIIISHGNVLTSIKASSLASHWTEDSSVVVWVPFFHTAGLLAGLLQPLLAGSCSYVMPPLAFLERPVRLLKAISHYRATHSGGPSIGYELCTTSVGEEERAGLDLSSWRVACNGGEVIRASTLADFNRVFALCGFQPSAHWPVFGMGENCFLVTAADLEKGPVILSLKKDLLRGRRAVKCSINDPECVRLVSSGRPVDGVEVVIVRTDRLSKCGQGEIGEIWVKSASMAEGYWKQPEKTKETFQAHLSDTGEGPFLRTGDMGFILEGELFITSRIKDIIVLRGENYSPADIEKVAEKSHPSLKPGGGVAFSTDGYGEDKLVLAFEIKKEYEKDLNLDEVIRAMRRAVLEEHGKHVDKVELLKEGSLPRTFTQKIQRYACKEAYLKGKFKSLGSPPPFSIFIKKWKEMTQDWS